MDRPVPQYPKDPDPQEPVGDVRHDPSGCKFCGSGER